AFASAPGKTADDNSAGTNGVYTEALLREIRKPGVELERLFKHVCAAVDERTNGEQTPWVESSIINDFYFVKSTSVKPGNEVKDANSERLMAHLTVTTNAVGAKITVDGEPAPGGEYAVKLSESESKTVRVTASAEGYEPETQSVELTRGKSKSIDLKLWKK